MVADELSLDAENVQLRRHIEVLERLLDEALAAHEHQVDCKETWRARAEAQRRQNFGLKLKLDHYRAASVQMLTTTISSS